MPSREQQRQAIRQYFSILRAAMGPQHWWPAESSFEVVVGAYLTQNTAWGNVELAMANLRRSNALSIQGIRDTPLEDLEAMVRPAGYFRQKAARLKLFVAHLDQNYQGSLEAFFAIPVEKLREELLSLPGIGPETADSILLYAANREIFVVDAYTRRLLERHRLAAPETSYEAIRHLVQEAFQTPLAAPDEAPNPAPVSVPIHSPSLASQMPRSPLSQQFNEFHALIVQTAKHFCLKTTPRCEQCPLRDTLHSPRRS